jgi:hypothetical protein
MTVRPLLRLGVLGLGVLGVFGMAAGCGGSRIDPPRDNEGGAANDAAPEPDSVAAWAQHARELWAGGDSLHTDEANALARQAFRGAWGQAADARESSKDATTSERLPSVEKGVGPSTGEVIDALTRVGLAVDVTVSRGTPEIWQVLVSDPVGSAFAQTEFWAWPDPRTSGGTPILQPLPKNAPARARYGPDAVGDLVTWTTSGGASLASAWARPRSRGGLEVALASRSKKDGAVFGVNSNRVLPIEADTVMFQPPTGANAPMLVVTGSGGRDPLFDDCPTCPHLERVQRYLFRGDTWTLSGERVAATPYAAFVAFLHALREGTPDSALPYASGPYVIEQAQGMGLELGRGPLRAVPGTLASDPTQRYRTGGTEAIEVTLRNTGDHWVVDDVRPAQLVIE